MLVRAGIGCNHKVVSGTKHVQPILPTRKLREN